MRVPARDSHPGKNALAIILAGGRGSRLMELTDQRPKPALPFGCRGRIIDFTLTNVLNSGISRIAIATQYKSNRLVPHLQRYRAACCRAGIESFDLLPSRSCGARSRGYLGTADAVFQNMDMILSYHPQYVIILAGDHIYNMDYGAMLSEHLQSGAGVTIGCFEVDREEAREFGVATVDFGGRVLEFSEKPAHPRALRGKPHEALASMGIYAFETRVLQDVLREDAEHPDSRHDFGRDVIPRLVARGDAHAHLFRQAPSLRGGDAKPYWRDVGTLDAYFRANIEMTDQALDARLNRGGWPPWISALPQRPRSSSGGAASSLISLDCIVDTNHISRSLLFARTRIGRAARLDQAVILPWAHVGSGARLRKVIVDQGVRIPDGLEVGVDSELDARRFRRTKGGVCLITAPMVARLTG